MSDHHLGGEIQANSAPVQANINPTPKTNQQSFKLEFQRPSARFQRKPIEQHEMEFIQV